MKKEKKTELPSEEIFAEEETVAGGQISPADEGAAPVTDGQTAVESSAPEEAAASGEESAVNEEAPQKGLLTHIKNLGKHFKFKRGRQKEDAALPETNDGVSPEFDPEQTGGAVGETVGGTPVAASSAVPLEKITSAEHTAEPARENVPLLQVKNLRKYFPIKKSLKKENNVFLKAVDGVSFQLNCGQTVGIVGESGCGKTTMGRTVLRLYDVTDGEILFEGQDIAHLKGEALRRLRPNFQMIFQDPYASLSPRLTVGELIGEAVRVHNIVPKSEYKDYIIDVMKKCGLQTHYFERYPHEFSGGQRQRICIAKALALKPKLVICDEPVSALDVSIQAQVINLFKDLQQQENLAYIFISHDLSVVEHISDEVGVMYLGNMVEYGKKDDLFDNPMHPYTQALFSAVPVPDPDYKMNRIILEGDIPSPAHPPAGCKFHTRCNRCMDVCKEVEPVFKDYGNGHCVACHLYPQD